MNAEMIYGLITGILFGVLLQKARVVRYDKQIGALRFQDMTIIKFMLSSVLVGMVGIYLLVDLELAELSIKRGMREIKRELRSMFSDTERWWTKTVPADPIPLNSCDSHGRQERQR